MTTDPNIVQLLLGKLRFGPDKVPVFPQWQQRPQSPTQPPQGFSPNPAFGQQQLPAFGAGDPSLTGMTAPFSMGQTNHPTLNGMGQPRVFASPEDQRMLAGNPTGDQIMDAYQRVGGGTDVSNTWPVQLSQGTSPFADLAKLLNGNY